MSEELEEALEEIGNIDLGGNPYKTFDTNKLKNIYDKEFDTIKQALNQSERNKKFKDIVISKCTENKNLIYVTICENYNDYLSLFEDKIENQYLLTEDEFNFLKEILKDE